MFWIIVAVVAVIGAGVVWWLSGRAKPLGADQEAHLREVHGDVNAATYRPSADQARFNRP